MLKSSPVTWSNPIKPERLLRRFYHVQVKLLLNMAVYCLFLRLRRANCFELSTVFYVYNNAAVKRWANAVIIVTSLKSLLRNELFAILMANIFANVNKNNRLFGGPQVDAQREKEKWTPKNKMATDGVGWTGAASME